VAKRKVIVKPKSNLGLNDKLKICYNCIYYQKDGYCPWEEKFMNYNDHCIRVGKHWPYYTFRYRLDLPYKLEEPNKKQ